MRLMIAIMCLAVLPLSWRFLVFYFQSRGMQRVLSHALGAVLGLCVFVVYMLVFFPPEGIDVGWFRGLGAVLVFSVISYLGVDPRPALARMGQ